MEDKPKLTQGQRKTRTRLRDLFENEVFIKELEGINKIASEKKRFRKLTKLAIKHSIEWEMTDLPILLSGKYPHLDEQIGHELDVCEIYDEVDEYLNEVFPMDFDIPPSRKPAKRHKLYLYPIHIGISPKATKRDVLDFIAKMWEHIRYMLDDYESNPKIIKKKRKEERDRFIWDNRNLPPKELEDKVGNKYPDENLTYADINTILTYLRKRKTKL